MVGMELLFVEIGLVIVVAAIFGVIAQVVRQPLIIAYILTGFILGPAVLKLITGQDMIDLFSTIGITFLLFTIGTELNINKLAEIGNKALLIGVVQIVLTTLFGYLIALLLGFSILLSVYIGIILAFSSTVVVVKLLHEKKALSALYGRIVLGVLIVQDIVALLLIIVLSSIGQSTGLSGLIFGAFVVRGVILASLVYIVGHFFLKRLFHYIAGSSELMLITSAAWCFAVAGVFALLGFSIEMGAFLAGMSIASLRYSEEISTRLIPLRDFFLILFFVMLGMQITFQGTATLILPIIVLVLVAIIIKPLIVFATMGIVGFTKRTSFYSALSLAQVSEFSLIILGMGFSLGYIDGNLVSAVLIATVVTIIFSSYIITFLGQVYVFCKGLFSAFSSLDPLDVEIDHAKKGHVVLFGYHRLGGKILKTLKDLGEKVMVVEIDPDLIEQLLLEEIPCVYGDAYDVELLDRINIAQAKMVITTVPAQKSNMFLVKKIQEMNKKVVVIATAEQIDGALDLYEAGASYVVLPHYISADYMALMLKRIEKKKSDLASIRDKHTTLLRKMSHRATK